MISIDTNILLFAHNSDCEEHEPALDFLQEIGRREDVVICELVLVELYLLLRNPNVLEKPLSGPDATQLCQSYRSNPRWRLAENASVMNQVWKVSAAPDFARRRIIDARLAFTLQRHGVRQLATANVKDFDDLGFDRVWNPLEG